MTVAALLAEARATEVGQRRRKMALMTVATTWPKREPAESSSGGEPVRR